MEYRNLGRSGLQVSIVGLGCNNFGMRVDLEGTRAIVAKCLEVGINLFDTADIYGGAGKSEEFLGQALAGHRDEAVIATKFGGKMGEGPHRSGASRKYIVAECEASLRRLGTDHIDLYQVHFPDVKTPIDETLRALDDLVRAGKVRYIGNSNFAGWQIAEADFLARQAGATPFISAQNEYNLLVRDVEKEVVPACERFGLGMLPYFPLASGFLTGKYRQGQELPADSRFAAWGGARGAFVQRTMNDRNFEILQKLEAFAGERGHTVHDLAMSWLACKPVTGSVIAGATKPEQVAQNAAAAEWKLTAEEMAEVDAMTK
jgi:aryl-alcohol dehydrogenase-like predicted oxidoreductase